MIGTWMWLHTSMISGRRVIAFDGRWGYGAHLDGYAEYASVPRTGGDPGLSLAFCHRHVRDRTEITANPARGACLTG
jgi:hypothetical protein